MDRILTTGASIQLRGMSTNGSMRGISQDPDGELPC